MLILVIFPNIVESIAALCGFKEAPNMLFLIAIFILFYIIFRLYITISKLQEMNRSLIQEVALLKKIQEALLQNIPVRRLELNKDEALLIKNFNLITAKKVIYAANVDEDTIATGENDYTKAVLKKDNKK